ncbi:unnamed protein product [Arabidopsis thaliana]|uniref:RRM domain-containing protein n=1 Tax=Arabidopsis thaliana TaxID=3702 RepID=A0A5S9WYD8_ARATH|nr:unnamed protein product [Arabidopsis thaliana]
MSEVSILRFLKICFGNCLYKPDELAIKVFNMIKLYGEPIRVKKIWFLDGNCIRHLKIRRAWMFGANLFLGNLDPDVDEKMLHDTFSAFGVISDHPKIMRDPDTGNPRGFGFISYDSFEASDAAIESLMHTRKTPKESATVVLKRLLAANSQRSRPHKLFATGPSTHNAPKVNGLQPVPIPGPRPPPQPQVYQTQPPSWPSQPQQQYGLAVRPPMQFRPPQGMQSQPPPPQFPHHQQGFGCPRQPPPYQAMGMHQHGWPPQHIQQHGGLVILILNNKSLGD